MATLYDGNGNVIDAGNFGVTDYHVYNDGVSDEREALLTYQGKKLYTMNHGNQRLNKPKMYNGGVMIALGDSYVSMGNNPFSNFASAHGLVLDNLGYASSTIAGSEDGITVGYHAFWKRFDTEIASFPKTINGNTYTLNDVKLITMIGGANDWWTVSESVDRLGDPTSTDKEQLYGACKYIFEKMYSTFPNADIIIILQPSNAASDTSNYAMWLKENIVKDCAEMYSLPVCDCRFNWHSPVNPSDLAAYWQNDHLHLNDKGYESMMASLENTLNTLKFYRSE